MTGRRGSAEEIHPLAPGQKALWFLLRMAPASAAYTIAGAGRVVGPVEPETLRAAFEAIVERHVALRTVFPLVEGSPVQRVEPVDPGFFEQVDASGWSAAEVPERIADLAFRPFDLERGPSFRVVLARGAPARPSEPAGPIDPSEASGPLDPIGPVLAVSLHHAVGDLWSLAVLLREVGRAYENLAAGRDALAGLPELAFGYGEWVARQAAALAGEEGAARRRFWLDRLAGGLPVLDLPTDRPRPRVPSFEGGVVARALTGSPDGHPDLSGGRSLRAGLGAVARARRTTRLTALMAGFQALLGRYTGQEAFAVGTPASGRVHALGAGTSELAGMVGYFVNPLPIRADLSGDPSFGRLVERVRDETEGALEHQGFPVARLAEERAPGAGRGRSPLFRAMLVLQKSPIPGMRGLPAFALGRTGTPLRVGPLELESVGLPQRGSQFDLTLFVTEEDGELVASLEYDGALFEAATAERMLGHLAILLRAAADDPERRIGELPVLAPPERRQLLEAWAVGAVGAPDGEPEAAGPVPARPLHALVAAQAERTPEAEALVVGEERLSYRELVGRGRAVGRALRARLERVAAGPEPVVGVFARRGTGLVAGLLGVLEAGAAYVPMDPRYPAERIALMVADSRMPVVLTEEPLRERLRDLPAGTEVTTVAEALAGGGPPSPEPSRERVPAVPLDHLAYVIYTSGSTGRPKGVAISHRSAAALVSWAGGAFTPEELSGVLFSTSVCFDLSVFELFVPLAHGGRAVLADDALALSGLAAAAEVTLVNTVPSAMSRLAEAGALPPSVRTVNLAGEPLRRSLVEAVYGAGSVRRVVNLYGPSEDTTYSTIAECPAGEGREPTLGRVVRGGRSYVVDRSLRPVPAGVSGELLLGGAGVARGYLGRPALTAERFLSDPFATDEGEGGGRLYRTGDRVRYLPDGRLEFLGRLDHQVKVRGFRIELGEVEAAVRAHPAVAEAVVAARGEGADRSLAAYLVVRPGAGPPPVAELRAFLAARLPEHMTPSTFVALDALPLTPNGKVDRAALPEPGAGRPALEHEPVPPETEVEKVLAEIWSAALGVEGIGIHDGFFELGGHSLKATEVLLRVRDLFGVDVPVHDLFERPTIAGLASAIADQLLAEAGEEERAHLLAALGATS
jgi:amino acid adenylation domain-containing protein